MIHRVYWIKDSICKTELCSWDDATAILGSMNDDIKERDPSLSYDEILDIVSDSYPAV